MRECTAGSEGTISVGRASTATSEGTIGNDGDWEELTDLFIEMVNATGKGRVR